MSDPSPRANVGARRARAVVAMVLLVLGGVLAGTSLLVGHVNRHVFDGPTFAADINAIRREPRVAAHIGEEISRQIIAANPDLAALRPLIDQISIGVAGSDLLSGPTRLAAREAHAALSDPSGEAVILRLTDAGAVVTAVLGAVVPDRVPVPSGVSVTLAQIGGQDHSHPLLELAGTIGLLAWLLPLLAAACFVGAVAVSPRRWHTAGGVGRALVVSAAVLGALLVVGRFIVRRRGVSTLGDAFAGATWEVVIWPLWWGIAVLVVLGVLMLFASEPSASATYAAWVERARSTVVRPAQTVFGRIARAVVAAVVGVAAILDPIGVIEPLVVLAGALLLLHAITEVARLAGVEQRHVADGTRDARARRRIAPLGAAAVGVAVVLATVAVVVQARPGEELVIADTVGELGCNGHVELCDRPFDEVAYAAAHNAMSVLTEPGWYLAEQTDPIPVQLDQGVRALLVDVWPGRAGASSGARTAAGAHAEALAIADETLGPEVVAAALRIADSVAGPAVGPERRFLCHGLCETGSTDFVGALQGIRGWLATHPNEVVTLFIEDYVAGELIAEDIATAGLLPFVATPPAPGDPWPTLGEMIASGERLVVMLENGDGGERYPWLVNGFEHTQDTPYTFPSVDDFSCEPNRGPDDASLFLVNHWLANFTSLVSDAELVNGRGILLGRMEQCRDERGQIPNFVAVNYVDRGDLFGVVDELNGVGTTSPD